ncbi:hypothetical protein [Flagellimonas sp.]|uniref:hypothetical protein n=1 Tax=Flagellimonas sp. TaxID=2058762 RepID=UPI003F49DF03
MAVLRKITASTLMETMVATVLIVVIFMFSSLILNTVFESRIKNTVLPIRSHLNKLEYLYANHKIEIPYNQTWEGWNITIHLVQTEVLLEAEESNGDNPRVIQRKIRHADNSKEDSIIHFE